MTLRERLRAALTQAMKARQPSAISILRTTLAAIDNAEAVAVDPAMRAALGQATEVPRKVLTEADIEGIVQQEMASLRANIAEYEQLGQTAQADPLRAELTALDSVLSGPYKP